MRKELWVIIAEKPSTGPQVTNLPEIAGHPGTFGTLVSAYYDSGYANPNLGYYLRWTGGELGGRKFYSYNIDQI